MWCFFWEDDFWGVVFEIVKNAAGTYHLCFLTLFLFLLKNVNLAHAHFLFLCPKINIFSPDKYEPVYSITAFVIRD